MSHITEERIDQIAERVAKRLPLSDGDIEDLRHMEDCEACYESFLCSLALMEALGESMLPEEQASETAVIRLVVLDTHALLEQLKELSASWMFDRAMTGRGLRGTGTEGKGPVKLKDRDNSANSLSYDPEKKRLTIRLEQTEGEKLHVYLESLDGYRREIPLALREDLLCAEVENVEEGEYRIILEKEA